MVGNLYRLPQPAQVGLVADWINPLVDCQPVLEYAISLQPPTCAGLPASLGAAGLSLLASWYDCQRLERVASGMVCDSCDHNLASHNCYFAAWEERSLAVDTRYFRLCGSSFGHLCPPVYQFSVLVCLWKPPISEFIKTWSHLPGNFSTAVIVHRYEFDQS